MGCSDLVFAMKSHCRLNTHRTSFSNSNVAILW